nr:T9SS type A sorting domain-containing protein [Bacteroidota bacterium]
GNTNQDIKASAEIWKFLKRHRIKNCNITSVPDREASAELRCSPNPFNDHLNITGNNKITKIGIYNLLGQEVYINELPSKAEISTTTLKEGIYFVKVEVENKTSVFKVIKKK